MANTDFIQFTQEATRQGHPRTYTSFVPSQIIMSYDADRFNSNHFIILNRQSYQAKLSGGFHSRDLIIADLNQIKLSRDTRRSF